jgi:hypothetical protein
MVDHTSSALVEFGWFRSHSGLQLPWKLNADALSDDTIDGIAQIIRGKFVFGSVIGIPRGGLRLAAALSPHTEEGYATIIVDDVLTIFTVNEWAQSRGTGLG